jgi:hypothetical protein
MVLRVLAHGGVTPTRETRPTTYDPPVPWSPSGPNEQPSTLPKDSQGQAINEDRRQRKAAEAEFEAKHGRKMSKKDRKRLRGD